MGAKQSTPAFDPGRTRAYSSSDLPSGGHANAVSDGGVAGLRYTNGPDGPRIRYTGGGGGGGTGGGGSSSGGGGGGVGVGGLDIPSGGRSGSHARINQSLEEEEEEEEDEEEREGGDLTLPAAGGHRLLVGSLPAHLSPRMLGGFHCPVCSNYVVSEEMEKHLLACFSKTRLAYNKDILSKDSGECAVCLEEMEQGDTIARLPCLCIYHKGCIDEWFEVNRSCPEHPFE
ncbi:hypothetical protein CRUP_033777 [Coryphaenoides rupestris]|nr:hypothetical protein CRUP_033777 [Coryphaenoides rupestris]